MHPPFAVIFPAAGKSSRFGGKEKKPFVTIDGRAVWLRTVELFVTRPEVKQCLLVVAPEDRELFRNRFGANVMFLNLIIVEGGEERFESVANALAKLAEEIEFVAVHDAVRPCAPSALIDTVFATAVKHGAAIPGLPVAETLKRVEHGSKVAGTVSREGLWQVQTPQAFRRDWLVEAYARRAEFGPAITDDAQLLEGVGHPVQMVRGSPQNIKITNREDLSIAELFAKYRKSEAPVRPMRAFEDERFS